MASGKPKTLAEIIAENQRLRQIAPEPSALNRAKPTRAEVLAGLMAKRQNFTPINPVEAPAIVEEVKPDCPVCGGKGQVSSGAIQGEPLFGKLIPCPNPGCEALKYQAEKRFVSQREQVARQFGQTLEYYEYASMSHYEDDDTRMSVRCARAWLQDGAIAGRDTVKRSLVFCGKVGTGKTYLISAIRNELDRRGVYAPFLKVRTMLKGVQRGYSEDVELRD